MDVVLVALLDVLFGVAQIALLDVLLDLALVALLDVLFGVAQIALLDVLLDLALVALRSLVLVDVLFRISEFHLRSR